VAIGRLTEIADPGDETSGHGETLSRRPRAPAGSPPRALFYAGLAVAAAASGFLLMHLGRSMQAPGPAAASASPPPASRPAPLARADAGVSVPASVAAPVPTRAPGTERPARPVPARPPARPSARPSATPAVTVERL
jgi:hypothetical protein